MLQVRIEIKRCSEKLREWRREKLGNNRKVIAKLQEQPLHIQSAEPIKENLDLEVTIICHIDGTQ